MAFRADTEIDYVQHTSGDVTISSNTEATPTTVIDGSDLTVDGATIHVVEFFCRAAVTPASTNQSVVFNLWASTNGGSSYSDLGRITAIQNPAGGTLAVPVLARRRLTPAAGTIKYRIAAWATTSSGTATDGAGGAATGLPIYLRVLEVVTAADKKISELAAITDLDGTEEFVVNDGGASKKITAADLGDALSSWTLALDLPLTTGTGWGMPAEYTNDGTKMIVGTGASQARNVYNTRLPLADYVAEIEIQLPSSGRSGSPQRAGLILDYAGSGTGAALVCFQFASLAPASNNAVYTEREAAVAGASLSAPVALDAWHTLRVHRSGHNSAIWVNGTFLGSLIVQGTNLADGSYLALYGYLVDAWFRNLKVWTPTLP